MEQRGGGKGVQEDRIYTKHSGVMKEWLKTKTQGSGRNVPSLVHSVNSNFKFHTEVP